MYGLNEQPIMLYETEKGKIKRGERKKVLDSLKAIGKNRCCRCRKQKDKAFFTERMFKSAHPYCKECKKSSGQKSSLKKQFQLSQLDYSYLLKKQKNRCSICKQEETFINYHTKEIIALAVDHCHETGVIRGLLCRYCNLMLGNAKDSIKTLKAAIKYLQKNSFTVTATAKS